jgi:hypothetical protein
LELDFTDYCLAHLFTNQDFQNGVIGLAWVGDTSGGSGGLCEVERVNTRNGDRSLNTGFTTVLNYNRRVPRAVSTITTTHELGHNFGSVVNSFSHFNRVIGLQVCKCRFSMMRPLKNAHQENLGTVMVITLCLPVQQMDQRLTIESSHHAANQGWLM